MAGRPPGTTGQSAVLVTGLGPDRVTTNVSSSTAQAARCLAASSGSGSPALAVREQATFRPPRTPTTTASTSRPVSAAEGTGCRNARLRSAPPTSSTEGKISRSSRAAAIRAARSHSRSTGCQERSAPSRACAVSAPRGVLLGGQPRRLDVRRDQDRVAPGDDGPHQRGLLVADHLVLEPRGHPGHGRLAAEQRRVLAAVLQPAAHPGQLLPDFGRPAHGTGTPSPAAPGADWLSPGESRSSHSSATAALCTFSTAFALATASRWCPLG